MSIEELRAITYRRRLTDAEFAELQRLVAERDESPSSSPSHSTRGGNISANDYGITPG